MFQFVNGILKPLFTSTLFCKHRHPRLTVSSHLPPHPSRGLEPRSCSENWVKRSSDEVYRSSNLWKAFANSLNYRLRLGTDENRWLVETPWGMGPGWWVPAIVVIVTKYSLPSFDMNLVQKLNFCNNHKFRNKTSDKFLFANWSRTHIHTHWHF